MPTCAQCGQANPEGFRFCGACAAPLTDAERARETRKVVTALFCDVTGSSSLGERLDPESLRRVMARYFEEARTVIERHGGTVEKFIGDAVMAVFGVPVVHEDDALRAVRAAAELRERLGALNEELERDHGVTLTVRTGVNTGEVVAGTAERLATGDAVVVAQRLEAAAPPGQVLVGETTYRLVRDAVEAEPAGRLALKGKSEPVSAYRLVAVRAGAAGSARRLDSPLVGRARELRRLRDAFEAAEARSTCELFTVLGAAGVGKSRLVGEFISSLDGRARILTGRCLPYGEGITFWALGEVLRDAAGIGAAASVVGRPCSSTPQPSGIGRPSSRALKIRLIATWLVAMSSSNTPSRPGAARQIGLVPSAGSAPPYGITSGSVLVSAIASIPCSAARIA